MSGQLVGLDERHAFEPSAVDACNLFLFSQDPRRASRTCALPAGHPVHGGGHTWTVDGTCLTCGAPERTDAPPCRVD